MSGRNVRTSANGNGTAQLVAELGRILHGAFTGTIAADCERGQLLAWEIDETFKSQRVRVDRRPAPNLAAVAGDLEALLQDHFTGRLVLNCTEGSVVRYVRKRRLVAGDLVPLEE